MSRTPFRILVLSIASALAAVALPATAQGAPSCAVSWGSLPKAQFAQDTDMVNDVRSGRHACFDRLVIDLGGQDTTFRSYDVRYVSRVYAEGSGAAVPVRGAADLRILLHAPAYDGRGNATYHPADRREVVDVAGYDTFRQVAWAGSYEGRTTLALGVRARLPVRVLTLSGTPASGDGPKLVIDVAHRW